jgi:hypothetical protein
VETLVDTVYQIAAAADDSDVGEVVEGFGGGE